MAERFIGIDVGAETVKFVELTGGEDGLIWTHRSIHGHQKSPYPCMLDILTGMDWKNVSGAAVSGRLSRQVNLPRIPLKQTQVAAYRFLHGNIPATVVSVGSHSFSILEVLGPDIVRFRQNSRCSQGTGNFLRQLVGRFNLTVEQADRLTLSVKNPAPLSGRCPVILKTDMTHLANKGESRVRILAGLFDAVCENIVGLVGVGSSPSRVILIGGVSRSNRIRDTVRKWLSRHRMVLLSENVEDGLFFEALGSALIAAERRTPPPALNRLIRPSSRKSLQTIPALKGYLDRVERRKPPALRVNDGRPRRVVLGFDIGSTGTKALAMDIEAKEIVQEEYVATNGHPIEAVQTLARRFQNEAAERYRVVAMGATGSGREIVGSLMISCYGKGCVFVLNEIAVHAEGALHHDSDVDTIFEIGGQDAKYIRLNRGRVVDAAMNEACSAGTGSFIEEQGQKFTEIDCISRLDEAAMKAPFGVSLGQHCSVFMAEIIDGCIAEGAERDTVIAGLYDSVIQNYLNRVKGNRSVGRVIFCQGMPFLSDALAAAVARQTGSRIIVPPNPGMVGALGIALLTLKERTMSLEKALDLRSLLEARVTRKDTFVCKATVGCGGEGGKCRIDRLATLVAGKRGKFTWGGACALHESGATEKKLPDHAPNPFQEREQLVAGIAGRLSKKRGRPCIAITDEFVLKGMFPFFATYLFELGFDLAYHSHADRLDLKRGIEQANVPFCAPMQLFHGMVGAMVDEQPDILFLPMLRELPRQVDEDYGVLCPVAQASPDILRWDFGDDIHPNIFSPVIDIGPKGLESDELRKSCREIAFRLGVKSGCWHRAFGTAARVQKEFEDQCHELGRQALDYSKEHNIIPVVVLGRAYTIYNQVLSSNVPAIVREQGAIPIPVDCYPVDKETPVFDQIYWAQAQLNLRAAHCIRRHSGVYSLFCSNYSCGPDSFSVPFYRYIMEGKPFTVIETDGHSGDAGTKTRVEAFLYCVREDRRSGSASDTPRSLSRLEASGSTLKVLHDRQDTLLIPWFSEIASVLAACLRGRGVKAESLPIPDRESLRIGQRNTSGKECIPMCLTLGSFLQRITRDPDPDRSFTLLMPTAKGPCRFGVYNLLQKVVLEQLQLDRRVRIWSPADSGYFAETGGGFAAMVLCGFMAMDMLTRALHDVRPVELTPGAAAKIHQRYRQELIQTLEANSGKDLARSRILLEVLGGGMFGCAAILRRAAAEYSAIKGDKELPTVLVVGEIYVRLDPFANDSLLDQLEQRGLRALLAPGSEWFEYIGIVNHDRKPLNDLSAQLSYYVQPLILQQLHTIVARQLNWPSRTSVAQMLDAAAPYVRRDLRGEAVLTVGGPLYEWRKGKIDGAVSVGPLECMPTKIAESQLFHALEREGLPTITMSVNGDPVDAEVLDNFAFETHERLRRRRAKQDRPASD